MRVSLAVSSSNRVRSNLVRALFQRRKRRFCAEREPGAVGARTGAVGFSFDCASQRVEGGNVAAAPGDADLGEQQILKRVDEYQPFTISAGVPFYWTSNVALTRNNEQSDFVVAPAAAAFYEPRITQNL